MDKPSSRAERTIGPSPVAQAVVTAVVIQGIVWCITGLILDGGVVCALYTRVVALYWAAIVLLWLARFARGRALAQVVAVTGWMAPAGFLLWLLTVGRFA